jgi:hypothetical protein
MTSSWTISTAAKVNSTFTLSVDSESAVHPAWTIDELPKIITTIAPTVVYAQLMYGLSRISARFGDLMQ